MRKLLLCIKYLCQHEQPGVPTTPHFKMSLYFIYTCIFYAGYLISEYPIQKQVSLRIEGALLPPYYGNLSTNWMSVYIQEVVIKRNPENISDLQVDDILYVKVSCSMHAFFFLLLLNFYFNSQNISHVWTVPLVSEELIGVVPEVTQKHLFPLNMTEQELGRSILKVKLKTNLPTMFPVSINYNITPIDTHNGTIYAALVLLALYILIVFEVRFLFLITRKKF